MELVHPLFKWLHIIAGITWIGLLYFFNWINAHFAATLDADTKKKVVPELMPRALYWFRWGAAWTWITGVVLLLVVYYHGGLTFDDGDWSVNALVMIAVTFLGVFLYDFLYNKQFINAFIGDDTYEDCIVLLYRFSADPLYYKFEQVLPPYYKFLD